MFTKKMTGTKLRTMKTMKKYFDHVEKVKKGEAKNLLDDLENRAIKKFKYWLIIENDFPYDNIADKTHILFTRRKVEFDWKELNQAEKEELQELKEGYLAKNYDVLYENLTNGQTVPGHFHLLLLVLKRFEI